MLALWRLEGDARSAVTANAPLTATRFRAALADVWREPDARRFTVFVFVSMLAYSAQDLILEPFAGLVMGYTPGQSTQLSGLQHGGVLLGMLAAAAAGRSGRLGRRLGSLRDWMVGGCVASGLAMAALVAAAVVGPAWPFKATVFALGAANGAFSIAAIASMMQLAGDGGRGDEGLRMGLFGAAQAIAFAVGGVIGTGASDLARVLFDQPAPAYACVFLLEALAFWVAARLAAHPGAARSCPAHPSPAVATAQPAGQALSAPSTANGGVTP
jgi:BCD family chlorophyll transporter-like MFS transporter